VLALTDYAGVYGAPRLQAAAKPLGLRALLEAEIPLAEGARLTVLVKNRTGYRNLCRLLTHLKRRHGLHGKQTDSPARWHDLAEHAAGLVCLTGGSEGPFAQALRLKQRLAEGLACVEQLFSLFGRDHVFLEVQRHGLREQEHRNQAACSIADTLRLPLLATNGVWYAEPGQRPLQDVLTCLRHKTTIQEAGRLLAPNGERYWKTTGQMQAPFAGLPAAGGSGRRPKPFCARR
jgi:error-prone DNA polymerase